MAQDVADFIALCFVSRRFESRWSTHHYGTRLSLLFFPLFSSFLSSLLSSLLFFPLFSSFLSSLLSSLLFCMFRRIQHLTSRPHSCSQCDPLHTSASTIRRNLASTNARRAVARDLDVIAGLPRFNGQQEVDSFLVVVDRFTKTVRFLPIASTITAAEPNELLYSESG